MVRPAKTHPIKKKAFEGSPVDVGSKWGGQRDNSPSDLQILQVVSRFNIHVGKETLDTCSIRIALAQKDGDQSRQERRNKQDPPNHFDDVRKIVPIPSDDVAER